jgi:hypothetical protein
MDDNIFGTSIYDMERTGSVSMAGINIGTITDGEMGEKQRRMERASLTPLERFARRVYAISLSLTSSDYVNLSERDTNRMGEFAKTIRKIGDLNPMGYVLGYYITGRGSIDKKKLKKIIKNLDIIGSQDGVTPPDVIRYCRYWIGLQSGNM